MWVWWPGKGNGGDCCLSLSPVLLGGQLNVILLTEIYCFYIRRSPFLHPGTTYVWTALWIYAGHISLLSLKIALKQPHDNIRKLGVATMFVQCYSFSNHNLPERKHNLWFLFSSDFNPMGCWYFMDWHYVGMHLSCAKFYWRRRWCLNALRKIIPFTNNRVLFYKMIIKDKIDLEKLLRMGVFIIHCERRSKWAQRKLISLIIR